MSVFANFLSYSRLCLIMSRRGQFRPKRGNCNKPWRQDQREQDGTIAGPSQQKSDRPKPPPGLKGRELGLWYRDHSQRKTKEQKAEEDDRKTIEVTLPTEKRELIEDMLLGLGAPGPSHSSDDSYSLMQEGTFKSSFLNHISVTFEDNVEKLKEVPMEQNAVCDRNLMEEFNNKSRSSGFQQMLQFREKLPAFKQKDELVRAIEKHQIVVVSGETGCGKSTQVAQFILDHYIVNNKGSLCNIVCTQPRRISAISVAERVAAERDERIGHSVGYQIRLEKVLPKRQKGCILFVTTGVLLKWMQSNPALNDISHIFLDEIHERDILCDFVITFLRYIMHKRPTLKIILMSATLNAEHFSQYFGGVPCIHIPGFTFPVKEFYLEDVVPMINFRFSDESSYRGGNASKNNALFFNHVVPYIRDLAAKGSITKACAAQLLRPESEKLNIDLMEALIQHICANEPDGAILVFVPGLVQIQNLHKQLMDNRFFSTSRHLIIPLHSIMPTTSQRSVFNRPPKGVRKIVIATNIAETSITIDDVVYVIDSGRNKMQTFDMDHNVSTLLPEWESVANARQKRGRAGRVQPGKCYKLFTRAREEVFEQFPLPEMQRTRLEEVVLQAKILQLGQVVPFLERVMDPPDPKAVQMALQMLRRLNALDEAERLTPLGYHLAKLPMNPQTGKMILMGAMFGCVEPVFAVAAALTYKDPFIVPLGKEQNVDRVKQRLSQGVASDHFVMAEALRLWDAAEQRGEGGNFAWEHYLSGHTLKLLRDMTRQFAQHLHDMNFLASSDPKHYKSNVNSHNIALIKSVICAGLYPNVAVIKSVRPKKFGVGGSGCRISLKTEDHVRVQLHPKSLCESLSGFDSPYLVYHLMLKSTAIFLHDVTVVSPMALLFFGSRLDIVEPLHGPQHSIRVDKMISFKSFKRTGLLVQKLRRHLDSILEGAVANPEVIDWTADNKTTLILKAIAELIAFEDKDTDIN